MTGWSLFLDLVEVVFSFRTVADDHGFRTWELLVIGFVIPLAIIGLIAFTLPWVKVLCGVLAVSAAGLFIWRLGTARPSARRNNSSRSPR